LAHEIASVTPKNINNNHKPESNASKWLKEECICVQKSDWVKNYLQYMNL